MGSMAKAFWLFTECGNKMITLSLLMSAAAPRCCLGFEWQHMLTVIPVPHIVNCCEHCTYFLEIEIVAVEPLL